MLTEAFNVNLEELVTKDYLTAEFAKERAYMDTRFAEQNAYIDKRFAEVNSNLKVIYWMLGIVVATTVVPFLERLISL